MKPEAKVGLLFFASIAMAALFAYYLGVLSPFSNSRELNVLYNFAGGIEEGSPVRVMGIKVGKVKKIEFAPEAKAPSGEEVKLRIKIQIDKKAWSSIRKDSKFFINLAGVIGEAVRGEDPPRIDQLISQSYGLAGKILEVVNKNEGSVTNLISQLDGMITNLNRTLILLDKTSKNPQISKLLDNVIQISDDVAYITKSVRSKKSEETIQLIQKLIWRLEGLDGPAIKKFFQEEGIKAKLF
jgi:phospholipid/cholesterol/gamma-HCH transport system substrate-binding protein